VLTDITVDFGGLAGRRRVPRPEAIPDLFSSQPVVLKGRYTGTADGKITIMETPRQARFERSAGSSTARRFGARRARAPLWAREA